jgi:transposase InsO family protein
VKANRADHAVETLCVVLNLSRSGYYAWLARGRSSHVRRDEELLGAIREEHIASRGIYGAPRIRAMLGRRGLKTSRKRVARLMRDAGIVGVTRRFKHSTTVRDPGARPAPDLVDRDFTADGPNQLWVADITHTPTRSGTLYLAMVLDVWSRKVVGWATGTRMPAELVIAALDMAIARRRPDSVIHHSDQGSQYTSLAFTSRCKALDVQVSMGSVGDCYDNAMAESFFATLEVELLALVGTFRTHDIADAHVFEFLEGFYNTRRLHSSLGMRSPVEFEQDALESPAVHNNPQAVSLPPGPPSALPGAEVPVGAPQATT